MNASLNSSRDPDGVRALPRRSRPGVLLTGAVARLAVAAALSALLWAGLFWVTGGFAG